jgi:magnesium-transporting ATPase (P-type)
MYNLIKAEINYIKYNLHNSIILVFALVVFALVRGFNPVNLICFIMLIQFFAFTHIVQLKESRSAMYVLLGLQNSKLAQFRIVINLIGFTVIYSLGALSYLILNIPPEGFHDTIQELFLFGGLGLTSVFAYLIISDLYSFFQKKYFIWFNVVVGTLLMIVIIIAAVTVRNNYQTNYSFLLIVLIYMSASALAIFSYFTFQKRESHVGSK